MSGAPKLPKIDFSNPVNTFIDIALAPTRFGMNIANSAWNAAKGPLSESVGIESEAQRTVREKDENAAKEKSARSTFYNDALNDRTLDATTRSEIEGLYNNGASSSTIAALLSKAQEGKGLYGIRRLNSNAATAQADQPGRAQLLGSTSTLGSSGTTGGGKR